MLLRLAGSAGKGQNQRQIDRMPPHKAPNLFCNVTSLSFIKREDNRPKEKVKDLMEIRRGQEKNFVLGWGKVGPSRAIQFYMI